MGKSEESASPQTAKYGSLDWERCHRGRSAKSSVQQPSATSTIDKIAADHKTFCAELIRRYVRLAPQLPPLVHDLTIDYTALKPRSCSRKRFAFRYKLEGVGLAIGRTRAIADKRSIPILLRGSTASA